MGLVREGGIKVNIAIEGSVVWGGYRCHMNEEGGTQLRKYRERGIEKNTKINPRNKRTATL